jgi:hypothetical protein
LQRRHLAFGVDRAIGGAVLRVGRKIDARERVGHADVFEQRVDAERAASRRIVQLHRKSPLQTQDKSRELRAPRNYFRIRLDDAPACR